MKARFAEGEIRSAPPFDFDREEVQRWEDNDPHGYAQLSRTFTFRHGSAGWICPPQRSAPALPVLEYGIPCKWLINQ